MSTTSTLQAVLGRARRASRANGRTRCSWRRWHGTVAVAKVTLRTRERLAVLRPRQGMRVLHTLLWPEEIREPDDLSSAAPVTEGEVPLAEMLME
ncbi:Ku protein [Streptomyces sp. NPDC058691]|uniref:Ku protein n=1 Tax=Streptomyces sp. NPDC058691 TaxID=3346601 RepID=UPI003664392B